MLFELVHFRVVQSREESFQFDTFDHVLLVALFVSVQLVFHLSAAQLE